jgi:hypothetical protein
VARARARPVLPHIDTDSESSVAVYFVLIYALLVLAVILAFFIGLAFRCATRQAQARELDQMRMRGGSLA